MVRPNAARCFTYWTAHISASRRGRYSARRDDRAHRVEPEHREPEPADLADHVGGGNAHVVQDELTGVDAAHTHLVVGATDRDPGPRTFDDEARDVVVLAGVGGTGLGEDAIPVGLHDARHPALGAVQHEVVAVADGFGAHARDVAAGLRLGEPEAGALLAGRDGPDVLLLLLLAARDQHRARGQPAEQQHQGGGVGVLGDLFDGEGEPEDPGSPAAVLLGHDETEQAGVAEDLEHVLRVGRVGVDLAGPGGDLLLRELAHRGLKLEVLGGQIERHRRGSLLTGHFRRWRLNLSRVPSV